MGSETDMQNLRSAAAHVVAIWELRPHTGRTFGSRGPGAWSIGRLARALDELANALQVDVPDGGPGSPVPSLDPHALPTRANAHVIGVLRVDGPGYRAGCACGWQGYLFHDSESDAREQAWRSAQRHADAVR